MERIYGVLADEEDPASLWMVGTRDEAYRELAKLVNKRPENAPYPTLCSVTDEGHGQYRVHRALSWVLDTFGGK